MSWGPLYIYERTHTTPIQYWWKLFIYIYNLIYVYINWSAWKVYFTAGGLTRAHGATPAHKQVYWLLRSRCRLVICFGLLAGRLAYSALLLKSYEEEVVSHSMWEVEGVSRDSTVSERFIISSMVTRWWLDAAVRSGDMHLCYSSLITSWPAGGDMSAQGLLSSVFSCSLSPKTLSKRRLRHTKSLDPALMSHDGFYGEETSVQVSGPIASRWFKKNVKTASILLNI